MLNFVKFKNCYFIRCGGGLGERDGIDAGRALSGWGDDDYDYYYDYADDYDCDSDNGENSLDDDD